jgi:glycosyltransferase involved in cell wall biosynthesis
MPKTILHIIESLAVGGAEVLLVESLKGFNSEFRHVLVYMQPPETLLPFIVADKVYCLGHKDKFYAVKSTLKLRKIIIKEKIDLIHAHNYWPTMLARIAKPWKIPLIFTVHSLLSEDAFKINKLSLFLEKLTYDKSHHSIFVSETVKKDYDLHISIRGQSSVIGNFAADSFFEEKYKKETFSKDALRMVAVGNLKYPKNYVYLIEAFKQLRDYPVYLDIYGQGSCEEEIQRKIEEYKLDKVTLKGNAEKPYTVLNQYDAFILSSIYEGMSLAVIEAMAIGLPCVLSDIDSNREVAGEAASYFSLSSTADCARKLINLYQNPDRLQQMGERSRKRAILYSKQEYQNKLNGLYRS